MNPNHGLVVALIDSAEGENASHDLLNSIALG